MAASDPRAGRPGPGYGRAASSLGLAGAAIESVVPAAVANLSRTVGRTLALSRLRVAAMLLALAAGVSIGLAATLDPAGEPQRGQAKQSALLTPINRRKPSQWSSEARSSIRMASRSPAPR